MSPELLAFEATIFIVRFTLSTIVLRQKISVFSAEHPVVVVVVEENVSTLLASFGERQQQLV